MGLGAKIVKVPADVAGCAICGAVKGSSEKKGAILFQCEKCWEWVCTKCLYPLDKTCCDICAGFYEM